MGDPNRKLSAEFQVQVEGQNVHAPTVFCSIFLTETSGKVPTLHDIMQVVHLDLVPCRVDIEDVKLYSKIK